MPDRPPITLFASCVVDVVRPSIIAAATAALGRAGYTATPARAATCCGQPAANAGAVDEARRVARQTVRALARTPGPIVVLAGSCTAMMRHHWPSLFAGSRDEAAVQSIAGRVSELTEFLDASPARPTASTTAASGAGRAVAYHASRHLTRQLEVHDAPVNELQRAGYRVTQPDDDQRCCGFGGTFAVKFPDVSVAMADEKLDALTRTGVREIASCDLSCLLHLEARAERRRLDLRFSHVAELL